MIDVEEKTKPPSAPPVSPTDPPRSASSPPTPAPAAIPIPRDESSDDPPASVSPAQSPEGGLSSVADEYQLNETLPVQETIPVKETLPVQETSPAPAQLPTNTPSTKGV